MESRLYLHIGPPKTASTALQSAFQSVPIKNLFYGGVYQPRSKNIGSLAQRLQLYTDGRRPSDDLSVVSAIDEIKRSIDSGISVLISEEMFLVSERNCSFTEKLRKLKIAFYDVPTTVIFIVRNPLDAIPSLYQELFPKLPLAQQLSFEKFCLSEVAQCFDYQRILDDLVAAGFNEYRAIDFASLSRGELSVSALLGTHFAETSMQPLTAMNVGNKVGNGRTLPRVSLKGVADRLPLKTTLSRVKIRDCSLADAASGFLDCVTLRRQGIRKLSFPSVIIERLKESYNKALELCVPSDGSSKD